MDEPTSKRFRRDDNVDPTNPDPSIVVHVRNLSPKATEADLLEALSHFGSISYATCMPGKRMALVEFEEVEGARSCVVYAQTNQIYVAGQAALFNYSTSKMIQRLGLESECPNHVLILTIYNAQYPINVNVVHQICEPHGAVRRIAILRRTMLQALVEFDDAEVAKKAKHAMNGADIYSGCCTLKVEFAKPDHVKVTRNDQDQWDYTMGPPRTDGFTEEPRKPLLNDAGPPRTPQKRKIVRDSFDTGSFGNRGRFNAEYGYRDEAPPPHRYSGGNYGRGSGGAHYDDFDNSFGRGDPDGYYNRPRGNYGKEDMGFSRTGGGSSNVGYARGRGLSPGPFYEEERVGRGNSSFYRVDSGDGPVLMIYGIDQTNWNCDKLFNVLCLFGNCERIKFMKSKPDTAMAQMGSVRQVYSAIDHLHGSIAFGSKLALRPSKQQVLHDIRDPFDLGDGSPSFRDYSKSRNQRYTTPELCARNRIVKPSCVLHWYNAPVTMTEEKLKELFLDRGAASPVKVTVFPQRSDRSSAGVCEFASTQQAVEALAMANHTAVDSPVGRAPYIVKLAFAGSRDGRDFRM